MRLTAEVQPLSACVLQYAKTGYFIDYFSFHRFDCYAGCKMTSFANIMLVERLAIIVLWSIELHLLILIRDHFHGFVNNILVETGVEMAKTLNIIQMTIFCVDIQGNGARLKAEALFHHQF